MAYKARLRELYADLGSGPKGPQWAEMARILNSEGLVSPNGKPWTGGNLKQNYERMTKRATAGRGTARIPHQRPPEAVSDTAPVRQPDEETRPRLVEERRPDGAIPHAVRYTAQIPLELAPEDWTILRDMIAERKSQRLSVWTKLPPVIPDFKPPKGSGTSLRLRQDFLESALRRAGELWPDQRVTVTRLLNWLLMWFAGIEADPSLAEAPVQGELLAGDEAEAT